MSTEEPNNNEYDSPWKAIIERFFPDFMYFFFPKIFQEIYWEKGYEFLETELKKITRDAEIGKRIADKLVKISLNDGTEAWVYIHIEIQGYLDVHFESRMFIYNRRIREKYNKEVVSLAILCDDNPSYRPHEYTESRWGCDLKFSFPIVKLIDYGNNWDRLEQNDNVFAVVVMVHLKSIEVKQNDQKKLWKMKLVRSLYKREWDRAIIIELLAFIDWVIALPKDMEKEFLYELQQFEQEQKMQYVTSYEKIWIEKGMEQGVQQGVQQGMQQGMQQGEAVLLLHLMKKKFGILSKDMEIRIEQADSKQLLAWSENVLTANTVDEVFY